MMSRLRTLLARGQSGTLAVDEEQHSRRAKRMRLCKERGQIEEAAESLSTLSSSSCVAGMNQSPGQYVSTLSETAVQTDSTILLPNEVDLKVVNHYVPSTESGGEAVFTHEQ